MLDDGTVIGTALTVSPSRAPSYTPADWALVAAAEAADVSAMLDRGLCSSTGHGANLALTKAAARGHTESVLVLLGHGTNVHAIGDAALLAATKEGQTTTTLALLDHGADVHAHDDMALCHAASEGHTATVRVLLERGADRELTVASMEGQNETVRVLLEHGADVAVAYQSRGAVLRLAARGIGPSRAMPLAASRR